MQEKGLEPSCCCQHTDLNRARLPFRHSCVSFRNLRRDKERSKYNEADVLAAPNSSSLIYRHLPGTKPRYKGESLYDRLGEVSPEQFQNSRIKIF